ncbi:hypothetical protein BH11BAC1_BH11BAC1_02320 [soil metagenome]
MRIIILFMLLLFTGALAGTPAITEVRNLYKASAVQEDSCRKLIDILKAYNETNNPLLTGYRACATMMMASYVINPFTKLSKFNDGKSVLEKCIGVSKENIELRYLRFSMQCTAPSFLGYSSSLNADKSFLLQAVSGVTDLQLKKMILSFFKTSDCLNDSEKQIIK